MSQPNQYDVSLAFLAQAAQDYSGTLQPSARAAFTDHARRHIEIMTAAVNRAKLPMAADAAKESSCLTAADASEPAEAEHC